MTINDASQPDSAVYAGQVLGARYRLVRKRVENDGIAWWDGVDETLSRPVQIYVIPPNHPRTAELLGAGRQAGAATDPRFLYVLDVLAYGPSEPVSMIVCQDVPGVTLQALLKRGALSATDAAWVTSEVATALAPLHEASLSHGELSPATVILTATGAVRIKGFMLFSALAGKITTDAAAREHDDVAAIGRIFYACLTGAWPQPGVTSGLPAAQVRDGHLATPTQVRANIPAVLDAICTQIIDPRPGATPLRTAKAISIALRRALGTAEPTQELVDRVAELMSPPKVVLDDADATTRTGPPNSRPPVSAAAVTDPIADVANGPSPADVKPEPAKPEPAKPADVKPEPVKQATALARKAGQWLLRRWWVVAAAVVLIVVIALIAHACSAPPPPPPEPTPIQVTAFIELDAKADGGDGQDHPDQVPFATDGNPETCWTSERYTDGYIPSKKPGIGLILDLGETKQVSTLTLTLGTVPLGMSVMVPNDLTVTTPPMDTVADWTSIDDEAMALSPHTVTLPDGTSTRFILLYFTSLPPTPDGSDRVQASVCEITATGP